MSVLTSNFTSLVRNFAFCVISMAMLASCSSTKKSAGKSKTGNTAPQPVYLENISIKPENSTNTAFGKPKSIKGKSAVPGVAYSSDIERSNTLQFKYSILMDQPVESVTNEKLINFLDEWYGIPYKYGGGTKLGIDCSAFSSLCLSKVFNQSIPRTTKEQYAVGKRVGQDELEPGDLVFFNTIGKISHVGVYLGNNRFAHASTSNGVIISALSENYYDKRYAGGRRIR